MKEGKKTFGQPEEQQEKYEKKFGGPVLKKLIENLSHEERRNFLRKRMLRNRDDSLMVYVEMGMGQPTLAIQLNSEEFEFLAAAGKSFERERENFGRGIAKRDSKQN
jgi:hypothetical protein